MILKATSEYKVVFLYLFWITTIFQTNVLFETNKCPHGGPLGTEVPGQLPLLLPPPLNPDLETPRPYFHSSMIRSRSDGKKLSIPSTSRTPAARRGAPSTHFKKRPLPALKYSNGRNCLTSVLAYHPFHHVPYQPVDEIFLSSLIQPKNNTAIQYLYLWFFNQTLGHSHVQWRS